MYALVGFRRPLEDGFEVFFETRQYTCFNGFNVEGAFRPSFGNRSLYVRTDADGSPNMETLNSATSMPSQGARDWQCLGMGFLMYAAQDRQQIVAQRQSRGIMNNLFCSILASERCSRRYYDAQSDGMVAGRRPLTPNETFMATLFDTICNSSKSIRDAIMERESRPRGVSGFLYAVLANKECGHVLFDIVGSERPAGQAVSYLQVFRNWTEAAYGGFSNGAHIPRMLQHIRRLILPRHCIHNGETVRLDPLPSLVPTLSYLFNNGDDSDILSFAGGDVCAYLTKTGFWSSEPIWQDNRSMIQTGRYSKGAQSSSLRGNFSMLVHERRRALRNNQLWPLTGNNPFVALRDSARTETQLSQYLSINQFDARSGQSAAHKASYLADMAAAAHAYWNSNPKIASDNLALTVRNLPSLDLPADGPPQLPTDGAASGFRQWVESETVH